MSVFGRLPRRPARTVASALLITSTLGLAAAPVNADEITFWSQPYGDLLEWKRGMNALADAYEEQSGTKVNYEVLNWSVAFNTWLTVAQGGAAPDCADMYWLHSFSAIGGDQYGPLPINEYKDQWPDLDKNFYSGSLQDSHYRGDFYGIPWRGDVRPLMYRTDLAQEAGLSGAPQTWDDLVTYAKAMTARDDNGNVTRWGMSPGSEIVTQAYIPYYWQAGGVFMTEDGKTATIDNDASIAALSFIRDLVWEHEVVSPEFMEKSYDPESEFLAGTLAMVGSTPGAWPGRLQRENPDLDGKWALAVPAAGSAGRDAYAGSGYFGVLRGTEKVEQCVGWIKFLSSPENMQKLSEASGNVSPRRDVMASDFWSDTDWKKVVGETLEHQHTSQHPSPAWSALINDEPGSVVYDMMYEAIIQKQDVKEVVQRAQARMQAELDRVSK
ncbi:extracellular solute-binding protein [Litoreibacter albidus]|uniref:Carbohydrate ABC transporter substrate-binding protein, CUT1 family n=1 Tax=Litoreibacter albidus TaxID=670155 RepID=A0A1H3CPL9_9RHOB|nr:extracellular solute-binding protein [Litoreibacter albidus]SDX56101.1 carbohydrate ABC transporter substrate-binding protein, CUT1 family [Litoreibacter albidus]